VVGALVVVANVVATASVVSAATSGPPLIDFVGLNASSSTSITLKVSINPNGYATSFVVNYGLHSSLGQSTVPQAIGASTSLVTASATLSSLQANTQYFVRVSATNQAGTVTSSIIPFSTAAGPGGSTGSGPVALTRVAVTVGGTQMSQLTAVACASATRCFAVGDAGTLRRFRALVASWTGAGFSVERAVEPASSMLSGIACPSASNCVAVGRIGEPRSATFAEAWSGGRWRRLASASPAAGGNGDVLNSVACTSVRLCWAVGMRDAGTASVAPLVERWNGAAWSVVATPNPGGAYLSAVSCSAADDCWAVGESRSATRRPPSLAEHWNGSHWSVVATPSPGPQNTLYGVSCATASACWAVGGAGSSSLVLRWSGAAWRRVALANHAGVMSGVACTAAGECWLVGGADQRWSAGTVQVASPPSLPGADVRAAACPDASRCIGVGSFGTRVTTALAVLLPL
jgi:Fibronectin type III domain